MDSKNRDQKSCLFARSQNSQVSMTHLSIFSLPLTKERDGKKRGGESWTPVSLV